MTGGQFAAHVKDRVAFVVQRVPRLESTDLLTETWNNVTRHHINGDLEAAREALLDWERECRKQLRPRLKLVKTEPFAYWREVRSGDGWSVEYLEEPSAERDERRRPEPSRKGKAPVNNLTLW